MNIKYLINVYRYMCMLSYVIKQLYINVIFLFDTKSLNNLYKDYTYYLYAKIISNY